MIVVINKLFQPLTYQTANGTGLHLLPRGRVELPAREVSEELRRAATRGFIALQPVETPATGSVTKAESKAAGKKEG